MLEGEYMPGGYECPLGVYYLARGFILYGKPNTVDNLRRCIELG